MIEENFQSFDKGLLKQIFSITTNSKTLKKRSLIIIISILTSTIFSIAEIFTLGVVGLAFSGFIGIIDTNNPIILIFINNKELLLLLIFISYIGSFLAQSITMFNIQRFGAELSIFILKSRSSNPLIMLEQANNGTLVNDVSVELNRFTQQFLAPLSVFITKTGIVLMVVIYLALNWAKLTFLLSGILFTGYLFIWFISKGHIKDLSKIVAQTLQKRTSLIETFAKGYKFFWTSINKNKPFKSLKDISFLYADSATKVSAFSILPKGSIELMTVLLLASLTIFFKPNSINIISTSEVIEISVIILKLLPNLTAAFAAFIIVQGNLSVLAVFNRGWENENLNESEEETSNHNQFGDIALDIKMPKIYDGIDIIKLSNNDFFLIRGESGSGKTSFVDSLVGLRDFHGNITFNKTKLLNIRHITSYVPQENLIFEGSICENLFVDITDSSSKKLELVWNVCNLSNITKTEFEPDFYIYPGKISGGQKQRIAIARSLLENKPIIVLDEAFSGIDIDSTRQILLSIKKNFDVIIIMISHDEGIDDLFNKTVTMTKIEID